MPIRAQCSHCSTECQVPENAAGTIITCFRCGEPFVVQALTAQDQADPFASFATGTQPVLDVLPADSDPWGGLAPRRSVCQACHREAPTAHVTFRRHTGAVVLMFHGHITGDLCQDCIDRYFKEYSLHTLLLGWWGLISFFVTPFCLLQNVVAYAGAKPRSDKLDDGYPAVAAQSGSRSRNLLLAPAICLIATASLGLLADAFGMFTSIQAMNNPPAPVKVDAQPAPARNPGARQPPAVQLTPEQHKESQQLMVKLYAGQMGISLIILLGAIQMLRLRTYWLALIGSVLASIPGVAPCCLLSVPFGIWAIVMLCMKDVRSGFA
jgi:hypothetical protein